MLRIAWRSLTAHKLQDVPDHPRHPARRGDDQRHLRAHRPDRPRLQADLHRRLQGHRRHGDAQGGVHRQLTVRADGGPARVDGGAGQGRRRRRRRVRLRRRRREPWPWTARSSAPAASPTLFFSYSPNDIAPPPVRRRGARRRSPARSASSRSWPRTRGLELGSTITGDHPERRRTRPRCPACSRSPPSRRSAGRSSSHTTLADAQSWFDMQGRLSEIDVKARAPASRRTTLAERVRGALPSTRRSRPARRPRPTRPSSSATRSARSCKPVLLALRRHRRAGRRVHHLQRVLDDRGAAAPRVRHAARARRVARARCSASITGEALVMGVLRLACSACSPGSASPPA